MRVLTGSILLLSFQSVIAQSAEDSSIVYSHLQLTLGEDEEDVSIRKGDDIEVTYLIDTAEGSVQEMKGTVSGIGKDYFMMTHQESEGATQINHSQVLKMAIPNANGLVNRKNYGTAFIIVLLGTPVLAVLAGAFYSWFIIPAGLIVAPVLPVAGAQENVETVVEMKVDGPEIVSVPEDADYAWWMDYWEAKSKKKSF